MNKRLISIMLIVMMLLIDISAYETAKAGVFDGTEKISEKIGAEGISSTIRQTKGKKAVGWKKGPQNLSSDSAVVMELSTGLILYEKKPNVQHYPASITKILTTLLCLEKSSLSETVTYSQEAVYGIEPGSSNMWIAVGEKLTMEQSLYCIMLESANEACLGVAEDVAGSVDSFVDMMNDRVKELGLKNTHFMNPNGLHHDKHYTSAYDMAVISREAMKNNTFRKLTGTKSYIVPKTNKNKKRYMLNHQELLRTRYYPQYLYEYCIGGKTGYTSVAGATLVTFAKKDGMELVCVTMSGKSGKQGEPNCFTDSIKLLNYTFENYNKYTIDNSEDTEEQDEDVLFSNYNAIFDKKNTPIHMSEGASIVLPKGVKVKDAKKKITYHEGMDIKEGENEIGKITYTYNGREVGSASIIYDKKSEEKLEEAAMDSVNSVIEDLKENEKKKNTKGKFSWKTLLPSNWKIKGIHFKKLHISGKVISMIFKIIGGIVGALLLAGVIYLIAKKKRKRRGIHYHKRHNRTWESFNKSLGDFKLDK